MYDILQIPRSTYYYEAKASENDDKELTTLVVDIFKKSHNIHGQGKITKELEKLGWTVSRRRISRIERTGSCI